jgi:hypothetical protein
MQCRYVMVNVIKPVIMYNNGNCTELPKKKVKVNVINLMTVTFTSKLSL